MNQPETWGNALESSWEIRLKRWAEIKFWSIPNISQGSLALFFSCFFFFSPWRTFENLQSTEYPTHIQKIGRRVAIGKQLQIAHKIPRDVDSHVLSVKKVEWGRWGRQWLLWGHISLPQATDPDHKQRKVKEKKNVHREFLWKNSFFPEVISV